MSEQSNKKLGRPKKLVAEDVVDEQGQERLDMADHLKESSANNHTTSEEEYISIEDITSRWNRTFDRIAQASVNSSVDMKGLTTVAEKWNKLNPFLQNTRIKRIYTQAKEYSKTDINTFLSSPGSYEQQLRALGWSNASTQQIYYNILRRSADIPLYNHYLIPDLEDAESFDKDDYKNEDRLIHRWVEKFNIPDTLKTIALEVKREGKSSYLLRNKFVGQGKSKEPAFCTLQKMPTDWVKITGKGQLGFTISFNMLYFLNIANSPSDYGDFMVQAWKDMVDNGIVSHDVNTKSYQFNYEQAINYKFQYNNQTYESTIESISGKRGKTAEYLFWLRMPFDICYTFGSDNSHPWMAPDTMGLMLKLQELTDYGQLAGLIASTPLTAVLTGEIETIPQPRAGKNESVFSPEMLRGYMEQFNQATSTNVEAWLWPAKNIKLQQLNSDVNSSDILNTATQNFLESAGEGGMTIVTDKPNVAQVTVAKQLAASQQRYVTLQMERVLNFIIQHKLGFKYHWKLSIWGDIFNIENERKFLKEIVANGNIALFPKLMSAEGLTLRDTKAIVQYIENLDFYKSFATYTMIRSQEQQLEEAEDEESGEVGRPALDDSEIENDATAASREAGDNIADNRDRA